MRLSFVSAVLLSVTACVGSFDGPTGHLAVAAATNTSAMHQGESFTVQLTVTNIGVSTITFDANICPGTLEVFDAAGRLVYDAQREVVVCMAVLRPRAIKPGETFTWQEVWPAVTLASAGATPVPAAPGAYTMRPGSWYWSRLGSVDTRSVTVQIVP